MRTIIIEDESIAIENLKYLLSDLDPSFEIVGTAESVAEGLELIDQVKPEVVFLDIEMGDGSGFDLLNKLDRIDFKVVFVTAYDQYALQAFRVSAVDYLLKPVDPEDLEEAVIKLRDAVGNKSGNLAIENLLQNLAINDPAKRKIFVRDTSGIRYLEMSQILYLKADGSYCKIYMKDGEEIISSKVLKHFVQLLPENLFMRIHRSSLINLNEVEEFLFKDGGCVVLSDGTEVYVSDDRKKNLLAVLDGRK